MADSPDPNARSPYFPNSPERQTAETSQGHPSTLNVPERVPSRTPSPTQYEFILQTGDESATTAKQKLKTVRSHVMKNYLHQQQQRQSRAESSHTLASSERRKGKQRARSSRSASSSRDVEQSPASPAVSEGGRSATADIGALFSGFSFSSPFLGTGLEQQSSLGYGYGPSVFLPVNARSRLTVPHLHIGNQQAFALDFAFEPPQDEVSGFAQIYVKSLIEDKRFGRPGPSFETLNLKGETVRIVKDTLGICGNDIPQSIVFAVTLLAFGCAVGNEWDEAKGHVEALQRLLDARGGADTVDFELQRTLTWTTYCLACALQLPPTLPPPLFINVSSFPLAFLDDAQIRAWRTVKRFPKNNNSFVYDFVVRLHQLGLATSSEWYSHVDQRALSNLYFEAMHNAIALPLEEPWNAALPGGVQGQEAATMFKIWTAGLPLFVWATTRHVRARLGLIVSRCDHSPIFSRVKDLLEGAGGYHSWPRGKNLEPVLSTLFYFVEACDVTNPWRTWCVETLRKVTEILKMKTVEEFKKTLEFFPSTEEYRVAAEHLWTEMIHGASPAGTPTLMFSTVQ